jgi:hypothetical protein
MSNAIKDQIVSQLDGLSDDEQARILHLVRSMAGSAPTGAPGKSLLRFAGMFEAEDARRMAEAIEEDCERIEPDEW